MHPALEAIRSTIIGTPYEYDLWLVGGAIRDELLGVEVGNDFDLVTRSSASDLAQLLYEKGLSSIRPTVYERFGTAMVRVKGSTIEIVRARRESYAEGSRKPTVEPASLEEDAARRDFTINTLMRPIIGGEVLDPLGRGIRDLQAGVLRTPLDAGETFRDDPLRMLRAVRFRWALGFRYADGLGDAIRSSAHRMDILSGERIRDELVKMLLAATAGDAIAELKDLGLLERFAPEVASRPDFPEAAKRLARLPILLIVRLAALEPVGEREMLRRLKFSNDEISRVILVSSLLEPARIVGEDLVAARHIVSKAGDCLPDLLSLLSGYGDRVDFISDVAARTPARALVSPLSGEEIMALLGASAGPQIGALKAMLAEAVITGKLESGDKAGAARLVQGTSD